MPNDVRAAFRFEDGLIAEHRESFAFHSWVRQALEPVGFVLGRTPVLRGPVQRQACASIQVRIVGPIDK